MADVEERFRSVRTMKTPHLWGDIESRTPRAPMPDPPWRRVAVAGVALLIAAAGVLVAVRAFTGPTGTRVGDDPTPAAPPRPVLGPSVDIGSPLGGPIYAFGSVWAASQESDEAFELVRVDPETLDVEARIPVESTPGWELGHQGFATGLGSLWMAGGTSGEAVVLRVDPNTNSVVDTIRLSEVGGYSDPDTLVKAYGGSAVGDLSFSGSDLWMSVFGEAGEVFVARIDATTGQGTAQIPVSGDWIREVFPFGDRIVVRTRGGGAVNTLTVIDASTAEVVASEPIEEAIFAASDDFVWAGAGNRLLRIDPDSAQVLDSFPTGKYFTRTSPSWLDGGLWFIGYDPNDTGDIQVVTRFNPETGETDASVDAPPTAVAMAPGEGALWVLGYRGRLTRVDLVS